MLFRLFGANSEYCHSSETVLSQLCHGSHSLQQVLPYHWNKPGSPRALAHEPQTNAGCILLEQINGVNA